MCASSYLGGHSRKQEWGNEKSKGRKKNPDKSVFGGCNRKQLVTIGLCPTFKFLRSIENSSQNCLPENQLREEFTYPFRIFIG